MSYFDRKLEELIRLLKTHTSAVAAGQGDRVFNFHYNPKDWAKLREKIPVIEFRLNQEGFQPLLLSFSKMINQIYEEQGKLIIDSLKGVEEQGNSSMPFESYNESLEFILTEVASSHAMTMESPIIKKILEGIDIAANSSNGVLLLTDVEMLHPVLRVSAFEQTLQGQFKVPTIFLYPGEKGQVGLNPSFLGIYKSDGNYRSKHIY